MHLNKKGQAFERINKGLVTFLVFILISLLAVLLIGQMKQSNIVCSSNTVPTRFANGICQACPPGSWDFHNTSVCCNTTITDCNGTNQTPIVEFGGAAWNATKDMGEAALLPPQFSQIIIIVILIVGILSIIGMIGYRVYSKMKR